MAKLIIIKALRKLAEEQGKYLSLEQARYLADTFETRCELSGTNPKLKP